MALDTFEVGGTELNAIRTAERLDRERVDVQFVCLAARGPLLNRVIEGGFRVTEFSIGSLVGARALREGARLRAFLRWEHTEVFHAHDIYTNIWGVPWARLAGVPLVIASRRWWLETNRAAHVWLNRWSYRCAHRVLANSPSVARLVTKEGVPATRALLVPNFVEDGAFTPPDPRIIEGWRSEFHLGADAEVVGIVANFHAIKDIGTLIRAIARLAPGRPRLRLVLVGDGAERQHLSDLAESLGLGPRVIFAGRRPPQPSVHWLFDVSALSSRGEGFPNAIVEAMAARRPVVATAVGGVPDAVDPTETGLLVPTGDDAAMARAIEQLLDDPIRARAMGERGALRARERFGEREVLHTLEAAYRTARAPEGSHSW
jgi:glycosyltransferase involved in cell wall biosynthesis